MEKHVEGQAEMFEIAINHGLEVDTEIDYERVLNEYCKAYPKILHPWLQRQFRKGMTDRLTPIRKAVNSIFWQSIYTVLQFVTFLWFVLFAVNNISVN